MTYAEKALAGLNNYTGDNLWEDVVWFLEGVDWDKSCEASIDSTIVVFTDGSKAEWNCVTDSWEV